MQACQNSIEGGVIAPLSKALVNRLPGTVTLRKIAPLRPGAENPQDAIEHMSVIPTRTSHGLRRRNDILDHLPALIGKLVKACHDSCLFSEPG